MAYNDIEPDVIIVASFSAIDLCVPSCMDLQPGLIIAIFIHVNKAKSAFAAEVLSRIDSQKLSKKKTWIQMIQGKLREITTYVL